MKDGASGACLLILGAVGITYLNAFAGSFQFDDYKVIVDNPVVHSWPGWLGDLHGIRPLLKLSYTINWTSGLGLLGFHLVNVGVHAANSLLVFVLARRFPDGRWESTGTVAAALGAALLFAVHPIQTEAVTYVCGRSVSLMASFYLASMVAYAHGQRCGSGVVLHLLSPALFLLALLTRETAVTLPLALLLWEVARADRRLPGWQALRGQAVHWVMLAAILVALSAHGGYAGFLSSAFQTRALKDNLLSQIDGTSYLLSRLLWPVHLNIDPALQVATGWTYPLAAKAWLLAALLAAGVASLWRRPRLAFGLLWLFLHLLPTNSLVPRFDVANERHVYLASFGPFVAATLGFERIRAMGGVARRLAHAGAIGVLAVLALLTIIRNHDYRSEVSLWERAVAEAPLNARAYNNLGYAYALCGDLVRARDAYLVALRLNPHYGLARNNLEALESARPPR